MADVLVPAFEALVALEREVSPDLQVFPFQPRRRPTRDCIWNWIMPDEGDAAWVGTGPTHRDTLIVRATVAVVEGADDQAVMLKLLGYADAFLNVIDPALNQRINPMPLGNCVRKAERTGLSTGLHPFGPNEPPVLGIDFPIELQVSRNFA
jgi:hypothetical protein